MTDRPVHLRLDEQLCFALYEALGSVTRSYRPLLAQIGLPYPAVPGDARVLARRRAVGQRHRRPLVPSRPRPEPPARTDGSGRTAHPHAAGPRPPRGVGPADLGGRDCEDVVLLDLKLSARCAPHTGVSRRSGWVLRQSRSWRTARARMARSRSMMRSLSSARGRNSAGSSNPRVGCCQRARASKATTVSVWRSTNG